MYYCKNNNSDMGIAYYNVGSAFSYNGWSCDINKDFAGCGRNLWVNSANGKMLSGPKRGERILIYQQVGEQSQVVTHVVGCVGEKAVLFSKQFPKEATAQVLLAKWKYTRKMKILAVLNPKVFGARQSPSDIQLQAGEHSNTLLTMSKITGSVIEYRDGSVYPLAKVFSQSIASCFQNFKDIYSFDSSF